MAHLRNLWKTMFFKKLILKFNLLFLLTQWNLVVESYKRLQKLLLDGSYCVVEPHKSLHLPLSLFLSLTFFWKILVTMRVKCPLELFFIITADFRVKTKKPMYLEC